MGHLSVKQSKWDNVKKNGNELVKLKFEGTHLGTLARMLLRIQEFDFNIQYRPGTKIPIPDLSFSTYPNSQE